MNQTWENCKKYTVLAQFWPIWPKFGPSIFFFKNLAPSVTRYHGQLSSCTISEKTNDPILRKLNDEQTDESDFIGCCPISVEHPIYIPGPCYSNILGPGYLRSKNELVWLWHLLVNLYIAHHFILLRLNPFDLSLIGKHGGLSTLCHKCGFDYLQRVLKKSPCPGYLCSEDKVAWL